MKKQILFFFLYAIVFQCMFLFISCDNCKITECNDSNTEERIANVTKNYFYFKKGSWWVYENEISNERDSMFVVIDEFKKFYISEACQCDEKIFVKTHSSTDDSLRYNTECLGDQTISFSKYKLHSTNKEFAYRFKELNDSSLSLTNQHYGIITLLPEYKGANEVFKNVYRCYYNITRKDFYNDSYYAPNVGLIRFAYNDGDSSYWNLIKYHVIQ